VILRSILSLQSHRLFTHLLRHHVRFFPRNRCVASRLICHPITDHLSRDEADKSGNCPAGFVADHGVGNPAVRDFYLQSHGGLLGSSFTVFHYQSFFSIIDCHVQLAGRAIISPLGMIYTGITRMSTFATCPLSYIRSPLSRLQDLAFTLCHSYARATRSVSIPAPVYCELYTYYLPPLLNTKLCWHADADVGTPISRCLSMLTIQ
jgi:eukaryotic translation initiation factor 2C